MGKHTTFILSALHRSYRLLCSLGLNSNALQKPFFFFFPQNDLHFSVTTSQYSRTTTYIHTGAGDLGSYFPALKD